MTLTYQWNEIKRYAWFAGVFDARGEVIRVGKDNKPRLIVKSISDTLGYLLVESFGGTVTHHKNGRYVTWKAPRNRKDMLFMASSILAWLKSQEKRQDVVAMMKELQGEKNEAKAVPDLDGRRRRSTV